jgi:hypothetical protein
MTASQQATPVRSLVEETPTGIDVRVAYQHLNHGDSWRMARLGARDRMQDEQAGYIQFDVLITRRLRVVVKLDADDTYAVEVGRMRKLEYAVIRQVRGLTCEVLGEVVEEMVVEESR